jgi:hypothetical protein
MNRFLRFSSILLLGAGLLASRPAQATHAQGGDLTYTSLGNNQYRVVVHHFRDCSGIPSPTSLQLTCKSAGCNSPTGPGVVTATMNRQGATLYGNQYCATLTGICTANGPANYETNTFVATVTLPPAAEWVLSTEECCRPSTANLVGQGNFRFEAVLHNQISVGGTAQTIVNTSPVSSNLPVFFIPWKQTSLLSNSAFDADGDSLVYSLDRPLDGCGVYTPYAPYPGSLCTPAVLSITPPCVLSCPTTTPTTYSATLPVAVTNDTLGLCPNKTTAPRFDFDANSGALRVEPAYFDSVSASAMGKNKYVVVVKITEYRKISGSYVVVGTARRDLFLTVYDCGHNFPPTFLRTAAMQVGTSVINQPLNTVIPIRAGEPATLTLNATDRNANQTVTMSLDYNTVPGARLVLTGSGAARLTFTPPLALPDGLYRVAVTAEDNACPLKGNETQTIAFRVYSSPLATRPAAGTAILAYPTPFTNEVQFTMSQPGVQQLTICDQLGRVVGHASSKADGSVRWQPGTEVPAGLYLARAANGTQTVRLLRAN